MSAMLFVLAGAAVVPAMPVEANKWFTSQDNPKTAMMVAERGHIAYAIDVAPDGTAIRCTTLGTADLDRKVCELVMKNARFLPARDDQGQPAFGLYDGVASFLMPGKNSRRPDRAKLVVTVDHLPDGVVLTPSPNPANPGPANQTYARVAFLVDGAGAISRCASMAGERRRAMQTIEALGPLACENVVRDYHPAAARNAAGEAVASVQNVMVRFEIRGAN